MCVSVFVMSLVECGVFWVASSAGVILVLPGPLFVFSGGGCINVASSGLKPGAYDA